MHTHWSHSIQRLHTSCTASSTAHAAVGIRGPLVQQGRKHTSCAPAARFVAGQGCHSCGPQDSHAPRHGICSVMEGHDEGVALSGDLVAPVASQVGADDLVMQRYGL